MASELTDAKRRIRDLEEELAVTKLAASMLKKRGHSPQRRFPVVRALTEQGISITTACRVLRANIHRASRSCYGVRRVHAELVKGLGIHVGRDHVALVISQTGLRGISGTRRRYVNREHLVTASDLVSRRFTANGPRPRCGARTSQNTRLGRGKCIAAASSMFTPGR